MRLYERLQVQVLNVLVPQQHLLCRNSKKQRETLHYFTVENQTQRVEISIY